MHRLKLLAGAIALAVPSLALAQGDQSNPGGVAVAPSMGTANQPQQGEPLPASRSPDLRDPAAPTPKTEAAAKAEQDRIAREAAARPKPARTVRMGERTVTIGTDGETAIR